MALIQCRECGGKVSSGAPFCPHCGLRLKMDPKTRTTLWFLALVAVLFVAYKLAPGSPGYYGRNAPSGQPGPPTPLDTVTAEELNRQYMQNEVAADERYRGRRYVLAGELDDIAKDFLDKPYVRVRVPGTFLGIRAEMRRTEIPRIAPLTPGSYVYLDCRGAMMVMRVPNADDCLVIGQRAEGPASTADEPAPTGNRYMDSVYLVSTLKIDVRNIMVSQEAFFADYARYAADFDSLRRLTRLELSPGNTAALRASDVGYAAAVTRTSAKYGSLGCAVRVGTDVDSAFNGVIHCK